jgi:phosphoribosylpyrophosphate synthetase
VPLAYAKGRMNPRHQSEHHVYQYKHPRHPAPKCVTDLSLMMLVGSLLYGPCIARRVGWWGAVTFVPSQNNPGPEHPVAELARQIAPFQLNASRILLGIGPGFADEPPRVPRTDRFVVPPRFINQIAGQHVLVVDDTWVSGDKAQSASLALKAAGAVAVTVICIARWLRYDWPDHRQLIETLHEPYNAMMCPVTDGACPTVD